MSLRMYGRHTCEVFAICAAVARQGVDMFLIRLKFTGESWNDGLVLVYDDRKEWEKAIRDVTKSMLAEESVLTMRDTQGHRAMVSRASVQGVVFVDFDEEIAGAGRTKRFRQGGGLTAEDVTPVARFQRRFEVDGERGPAAA